MDRKTIILLIGLALFIVVLCVSAFAEDEQWVVARLHDQPYQNIMMMQIDCSNDAETKYLVIMNRLFKLGMFTGSNAALLKQHAQKNGLQESGNRCIPTMTQGHYKPRSYVIVELVRAQQKAREAGDKERVSSLNDAIEKWMDLENYKVDVGTLCGEPRNPQDMSDLRIMTVTATSGFAGYAHCKKQQ